MKPFIFLYSCGIACVIANTTEWTEENRRKEANQVALWESKLFETQDELPNVRLRELWLGLRNMGHRRSFEGHSPAVDEAYLNIQQELLSIPGHAKYYADELERLRLDPKSNYERIRPTYLAETLRHLPSPETIQILGEFLSDMRDTPLDENPKYNEAVRSGEIKPIDWAPTPQNAWLATFAFSNIGLQNPPFEPVANYNFIRIAPSAESLPKFRAWWDEVKSGKRTFSFTGQTVEYRFKPDGTWETVAVATPPDDKPKLPDAAPPQREDKPEKERVAKPRPTETGPVADASPGYALWKWATAVFFLLLVAGLWAKLRRR